MKRPLIIGHRGAPVYARENTLASFEQAIALKADMVEFDVHRTRDQVLIIHHDADIFGKSIHQLRYGDILEVAPDVPTLEEAIALCKGKIQLDVELKEARYERQVIDLLLQSCPSDSFVITSFDPRAIEAVKHHYPAIRAGFLFGEGTVDFCRRFRLDAKAVSDRIRQMQADFIAPHWELLGIDLLANVVGGQFPLWVWTVNDALIMQQLLEDWRIEGIITDRPDLGWSIRENRWNSVSRLLPLPSTL